MRRRGVYCTYSEKFLWVKVSWFLWIGFDPLKFYLEVLSVHTQTLWCTFPGNLTCKTGFWGVTGWGGGYQIIIVS